MYNKERCRPSSSIRIKSLITAVADQQYSLKGIPGKDQDKAKLTAPLLRQTDIFKRNFCEPKFLHQPIFRKALKRFTKIPVPHD